MNHKLLLPSIIVEGYDGCGKSTLVKELSVLFNMRTYHPGGPARDAAHAEQCCLEQLELAKTGIIFDRVTPISRLCYQLSHQDNLRIGEVYSLILHLTKLHEHCAIIWCTHESNDHNTVNKEYDTEEHLADIKNRRLDILKAYTKVMSNIQAIQYDFRSTSINSVIAKLTCKS